MLAVFYDVTTLYIYTILCNAVLTEVEFQCPSLSLGPELVFKNFGLEKKIFKSYSAVLLHLLGKGHNKRVRMYIFH